LPTSINLAYLGSHDLNFSSRPVRTRMPGGVGGDQSGNLTAPYPDDRLRKRINAAVLIRPVRARMPGVVPKMTLRGYPGPMPVQASITLGIAQERCRSTAAGYRVSPLRPSTSPLYFPPLLRPCTAPVPCARPLLFHIIRGFVFGGLGTKASSTNHFNEARFARPRQHRLASQGLDSWG
jgi:hypothetical protein